MQFKRAYVWPQLSCCGRGAAGTHRCGRSPEDALQSAHSGATQRARWRTVIDAARLRRRRARRSVRRGAASGDAGCANHLGLPGEQARQGESQHERAKIVSRERPTAPRRQRRDVAKPDDFISKKGAEGAGEGYQMTRGHAGDLLEIDRTYRWWGRCCLGEADRVLCFGTKPALPLPARAAVRCPDRTT